MKRALPLIFLALAGCAQTRYVTVYCITKEQLEKLKADKPAKIHDKLTGKADQDIKPIAGRLVRVEAWGDGLITVLGGCVDPKA